MIENSENFASVDLIQKLQSLNLPTKDYVIFGSTPIAAHGLMDFSLVKDLDIIARGDAWKKAVDLSEVPPKETDLKFGQFLGFFEEKGEYKIQIFTGWPHGEWNIDELIDNADIIGGMRFVKLENVLKWKKTRNRPSDAEQIEILEKYLQK